MDSFWPPTVRVPSVGRLLNGISEMGHDAGGQGHAAVPGKAGGVRGAGTCPEQCLLMACFPGRMWAPLAGGPALGGSWGPSPPALQPRHRENTFRQRGEGPPSGCSWCGKPCGWAVRTCGEITSVPIEASSSRPAQPFGGNMLLSALIAPRWILEVLWIVQQAYCH